MSYIYLVDLNSYLSDDEIKQTDLCRCCLSTRNILALANDCCVYLLPLEKPNELIPVTLSNSPCLDLAWSNDGLFLLNVTKNGVCNLYNVKTNLLNSIDLVYTFQINKNELSCVKPFSKSSKLCLNTDKKDSLNYFEKYYYNSSLNCLLNVGSSQSNGFLLLTKTGMIHIFLTDYNSVKSKFQNYDFDMKLKEIYKTENMMDFDSVDRNETTEQDNEIIIFDLGDFTYETDGSLTVAYTNCDATSSIYLYKVNLGLNNETTGLLEGTCSLITIINFDESIGLKSSILFISNHSAKTLSVITNQNTLQFWSSSSDKQNWDLVHTFQSPKNIIRLNIPKCKDNFIDDKAYILISYENGTTGYIDYDTYSQDFILPAIPSSEVNANKNKEYLIMLDQSFSGSIGVGITNNCTLVAFRQFSSNIDYSSLKTQKILINFYEYCLLTGYDYWDLLINTNPKMIEMVINTLEKRYLNQSQQSVKKAYFSRIYSLIYSLSRRSTIKNVCEYKSLDILAKIALNRSTVTLSNSIQLNLNVEALITSASNPNMNINSSMINTSIQPPLINTSIISSNIDSQGAVSTSNLSHLPFKTNLNEYFSDILSLDKDGNNETLNLNEIVQATLNRKNYSVTLNQQVKHVFQWIVDISLYIINEATISENKANNYVSSLLNDLWFLNELRKGLIFIKLVYAINQMNIAASNQTASSLIGSSLPILPFKSIVSSSFQQKDIISDLFNIVTKIIQRISSFKGETVNHDYLVKQCLAIQADLITKNKFDDKFFNLKYTWFGSSTSSWLKTFHFPVDFLFDIEKTRDQYPLFDIIRLVEFSRSNLTKQCFRCGNYTESNNHISSSSNAITNNNINNSNSPNTNATNNSNVSGSINANNSKINGAHIQDLSGDKCICGGFWVLSSLLQ